MHEHVREGIENKIQGIRLSEEILFASFMCSKNETWYGYDCKMIKLSPRTYDPFKSMQNINDGASNIEIGSD